jgi:hypothetical protein
MEEDDEWQDDVAALQARFRAMTVHHHHNVWEAEAAALHLHLPVLPVGRAGRRRRRIHYSSRLSAGQRVWAFFRTWHRADIVEQQFAGTLRQPTRGTELNVSWEVGDCDRVERMDIALARRFDNNYDTSGRPRPGLSLFVFWRAFFTAFQDWFFRDLRVATAAVPASAHPRRRTDTRRVADHGQGRRRRIGGPGGRACSDATGSTPPRAPRP